MEKIFFNKRERQSLIIYTRKLLVSCKELGLSGVPDKLSSMYNLETWQDSVMDIAIDLKKSLGYLKNKDMVSYKEFLSSGSSLCIRNIVNGTTNYLLEYFNPYRILWFRILFRGDKIAKKRLNIFRDKLGLPPVK